jgi:hypothetical protein
MDATIRALHVVKGAIVPSAPDREPSAPGCSHNLVLAFAGAGEENRP